MNDPHKVMYKLTDVRKTFGARTVLNIPSLEIRRGEVFALVGPSGAGKSTLLRLLALLDAPSTGTIAFFPDSSPVTLNSATVEDRRRLAMVFQSPALLSRSVRANVAYGLRVRGEGNSRHLIDETLERVSLTALAEAHARTLSGGEVQRVALARALILRPRVLLLDEPTANLDPTNVRIIEHLIREQHTRYDTTIVMVTHNIFQARRLATQVAFLLEGELVEVGPAEEFFQTPKDPRTASFISGDLVY